MPHCTNCGREFNEDTEFCPYCKSPLIKERSEGFKVEEIPEYFGRKSLAIVMVIVGVILGLAAPVSFFVIMNTLNEQARYNPSITYNYAISVAGGSAIILLIIGIVLAAYGEHYWKKVTTVMWVRQALREYGVPSLKTGSVGSEPSKFDPAGEIKEEQIELTAEKVKQYLDLIEMRFIEGKMNERTYNYLREKYESKLKSLEKAEEHGN